MRPPVRTLTVVLILVAGLLLATTATALASTGGAGVPEAAPGTSGTGTSDTTPSNDAIASSVRPTGVATWFGPGFFGKKTACGQTLTPAVEGLANRTLPCGTLIRVGYHGHSITLPVLDRGPYSHIAQWDLTAGAAATLGITETVRIHTSFAGTATNSPTLGLPETPAALLFDGGAIAG
jgi:rare lipoprotein A